MITVSYYQVGYHESNIIDIQLLSIIANIPLSQGSMMATNTEKCNIIDQVGSAVLI